MNICEFSQLDNDQQVDIVWKHGVIVASRIEDHYKYLLLQLYGFYVEIRYDAESNALDFVTTFVGTDRLDPYLNKIDISSLLNTADYE